MTHIFSRSSVAAAVVLLTTTALCAGTITADEDGTLSLDSTELTDPTREGGAEIFQPDLLDTLLGAMATEQNEQPSPEVQWAIRALDKTGSEDAFNTLQRVLSDDRRDASGWAFLAIWSVDNDKIDVARAAASKARDLNARHPLTQVAMALVRGEDGDLEGAVTTLRNVTIKFPDNFSAAQRLSDIYAKNGQIAAAVAPLATWLSRKGVREQTAPVALRVSRMSLDLKDYDRALTILADYTQLTNLTNAERNEGFLLATEGSLDAGDLDKAGSFLAMGQDWKDQVNRAAVLTAAIQSRQGDTSQSERQLDALKGDPVVGVLASRYLAEHMFEKGNFAEGSTLYDAAFSGAQGAKKIHILEDYVARLDAAGMMDEADEVLKTNAGEIGIIAHVLLADRQLQQERFAAAADSSAQGVAAFPTDPELHYLLGMAHFLNGDTEVARASFLTATELNPDHARAWVSLAKLAHNAGGHGGPGRHVEVIDTYMRALEVSPNNAIIEIELGKVAQEEERLEDAERWLRKSLVSAPSDPLAEAFLAIILADTNRLPEAMTLANSALSTFPDHHQVLFSKGRVELAAGNFASASKSLLEANAIRPEHGHSLAYAAVSLAREGRMAKAAEVAENALLLALRENEVKFALDILSEYHGSGAVAADLSRIDTDGVHETHGLLDLRDTPMGLKVSLELSGAREGVNSVHLHEQPNCMPKEQDGTLVAGLSAGAHYGAQWVAGDPHAHHKMGADSDMADMDMSAHGPMVMSMDHGGHSMDMVMRSHALPVGDLPPLMAGDDGDASYTVFVPYLHTSMLKNRSVVVHDGTSAIRAFCGVLSE